MTESSIQEKHKLIFEFTTEKHLQQAATLPPHIVIAAEHVSAFARPEEILQICRCFVSTLVQLISARQDYQEEQREKEEREKEEGESKSEHTQQRQQEEVKPGVYLPASFKSEETSKPLENQSSEKIAKTIAYGLEEEFLPFVMQATASMEEREASFLKEEEEEGGSEGSEKPTPVPDVAAVFTYNGELMQMGSLLGCSVGVAGVFIPPEKKKK